MPRSGVEVNDVPKLRPVVPLADPGEYPGVDKAPRRWVTVADLEDLSVEASGDHQRYVVLLLPEASF